MSLIARTTMADIEAKIGVQPIEELLAERAVLVRQVATLRAKHGAFGTFNDLRKITLSQVNVLIRARALKDGRKVSESALDVEAHAHPTYVEMVTQATNERAEWAKLEEALQDIEYQINRGQAVAKFVTAEAHL